MDTDKDSNLIRDGPMLKQPTFDCSSVDKYMELKNLRLEKNNILKTYNRNQHKRQIIKHLLGRQTLQFQETHAGIARNMQ